MLPSNLVVLDAGVLIELGCGAPQAERKGKDAAERGKEEESALPCSSFHSSPPLFWMEREPAMASSPSWSPSDGRLAVLFYSLSVHRRTRRGLLRPSEARKIRECERRACWRRQRGERGDQTLGRERKNSDLVSSSLPLRPPEASRSPRTFPLTSFFLFFFFPTKKPK